MSPHTRPSTKMWVRRVLLTALAGIVSLSTLAVVVFAGAVVTGRSVHQSPPTVATGALGTSLAYTEPAGATNTRAHSRRLVVAFVAGTAGTIASDLLAPYDIFASSPEFSTYVVSEAATPVPLESGPAVIPTYTFADVDANPALKPDLVVVPGLTKPTGTTEALLRSWVAREHAAGAKVLSVCSGAMVLAATGMLDGLDATSHWSRISALEASRPAVHWLRGVRYVEDGSVTTTGAVTSGVPAALHLVAELAGPTEARRVADLHPELHWTPTQTTRIAKDHFAARDWPVGLNYVLPWLRPAVGIALRDGVGELDATAAFEVYGQSAAARTVALATGDTVRTRHGLVLITTRYTHASSLSRVVVPGAASQKDVDSRLRAWAHDEHLVVEPLVVHDGSDHRAEGGFNAALKNLADQTDAATAEATAKMIGYPVAGDGPRFSAPVLEGAAVGPGGSGPSDPHRDDPCAPDPAATSAQGFGCVRSQGTAASLTGASYVEY